jgi:hypothetical protein
MYFRKLNLDYNKDAFADAASLGDYRCDYMGQRTFVAEEGLPHPAKVDNRVITFNINNVAAAVPKAILDLKPDTIWWVKIINGVKIHTDVNIACCINMYLETAGDLTIFHSLDTDYVPTDEKSFIARPFDVYLFNTSKMHSVRNTSNATRRFLKISWVNKTCDEVNAELLAAGI